MCDVLVKAKKIAKCPYYGVAVGVVSLLSYVYFLSHVPIGVDTLASDRYLGGELFAQGRFVGPIIETFFPYESTFLVQNVLGIAFYAFASLIFASLLWNDEGNDKRLTPMEALPAISFSCVFISYPMIAEEFIFKGTSFAIGACMVLTALALAIIDAGVKHKFLIASLLIMMVAGWHEGELPVYVCAVFALLYTKERWNGCRRKFKEVFLEGLEYVWPLVFGVALKMSISMALQLTFGLTHEVYSSNQVLWGSQSLSDTLHTLLLGLQYDFVLKVFSYLPVTLLAISLVYLSMDSLYSQIKGHSRHAVPLMFGALTSLVILSLVRGAVVPYRSSQVLVYFVAFSAFAFCMNMRKRKIIAASVVLVLVLNQVFNLNYWFETNQIRSNQELGVLYEVGSELAANHDIEKPVIYTGFYSPSEYLQKRLYLSSEDPWVKLLDSISPISSLPEEPERCWYPISQSIGESMITWGIHAYGGQTEIRKIMSYVGFDYIGGTSEQVSEATGEYIESDAPYVIEEHSDYINVRFTGEPFYRRGLHAGSGV